MEFGNWTESECTEECGSLGVWKETRTCKEKDNTTDYCETIAKTQRITTKPCNRKLCLNAIVGIVLASVIAITTIAIVFAVMFKRRTGRKRSATEEQIWNTAQNPRSLTVQNRTPQLQKKVEEQTLQTTPNQVHNPIPQQTEKPAVPARKSPIQNPTPAPQIDTVEAPIPSHFVLKKEDDRLKEDHRNLAKNDTTLHGEFLQVVAYVRDHVKKEKNVGKQQEYKIHNRYRDIGML